MDKKEKTILVITAVNLQNPMRGTPIRIVEFIKQMKKEYNVIVSAPAVDEGFVESFFPTPKGSVWERLDFYRSLIKQFSVDLVFTPTETDIKMPIALKLLVKIPITIDIHGLSAEEQKYFGNITGFKAVVMGMLLKFYLLFYDHIYFVSEKARYYMGFPEDKTSAAYGGVHLEVFPNCFKYRGEESLKISYMGNARSYQGLDILAPAVKQASERRGNVWLDIIVSSGKKEVEELVRKERLQDITRISEGVPHHEISNHLIESDVIVIPRPSLVMTEYAYPTKLPECLATGVPCILTRVGPVNELFSGGDEPCVLVEPGSVASMTKGLLYIGGMNKKDRQQLGQRGREYVAKYLTWDTIGNTIREPLRNL